MGPIEHTREGSRPARGHVRPRLEAWGGQTSGARCGVASRFTPRQCQSFLQRFLCKFFSHFIRHLFVFLFLWLPSSCF